MTESQQPPTESAAVSTPSSQPAAATEQPAPAPSFLVSQATALASNLVSSIIAAGNSTILELLGYGDTELRKRWTDLILGAEPAPVQATVELRDITHARILDLALKHANASQDVFANCLVANYGITRDTGRLMFKAAREQLQAAGKWPEPLSKFAVQAEAIADAKTDAMLDAGKGEARKQKGMGAAHAKEGSLVQIARRTARGLAQHGPVTIDDVTVAMNRDHKVAPNTNGERQSWKGSVFSTGEWVAVGSMPSRLPEAHARPVQLWALKEWLQTNTLNGTGGTTVSAYNLERICGDFKHAHPGMDLGRCNWYIGDECLAKEVRLAIVKAGNKYMGVPVAFVPGGVGAIIMAPDYARAQAKPPEPTKA